MVDKIRLLLMKFIFGKEREIMMAMLWAQQIMLGKRTFSQVPKLLKMQVQELLTDSGYGELATKEE